MLCAVRRIKTYVIWQFSKSVKPSYDWCAHYSSYIRRAITSSRVQDSTHLTLDYINKVCGCIIYLAMCLFTYLTIRSCTLKLILSFSPSQGKIDWTRCPTYNYTHDPVCIIHTNVHTLFAYNMWLKPLKVRARELALMMSLMLDMCVVQPTQTSRVYSLSHHSHFMAIGVLLSVPFESNVGLCCWGEGGGRCVRPFSSMVDRVALDRPMLRPREFMTLHNFCLMIWKIIILVKTTLSDQ